MNFDESIKCHAAWKQKLAAYILRPDKTLKSTDVSSDRNCDLGKWINGEGSKYASLPEFAKLKTAHAQFHLAAGEVIRKADAGQKISDQIALGASSPYAKASTEVVGAIMAIRQKVQ